MFLTEPSFTVLVFLTEPSFTVLVFLTEVLIFLTELAPYCSDMFLTELALTVLMTFLTEVLMCSYLCWCFLLNCRYFLLNLLLTVVICVLLSSLLLY